MPVKFNESLPALVSLLHQMKVDLLKVLIVRDGLGRLVVASPDPIAEKLILDRAIRASLGAYAAPLVLIEGVAARNLEKAGTFRNINLDLASGSVTVRFADRRIVGADWLSCPTEPVVGPPRLVFASLKGGVGRSTALTVLAADLARKGKRVLAIDFDLEAPGIGFMLLPASDDLARDKRPKYGAVDYLVENSLNGFDDAELLDCVGVAKFAEGFVHVVPAVGRTTDQAPETMLAKLSRAMVEDVGGGRPKSVGMQMNEMVERFSGLAAYDAILIDARAGMAEISAAPMVSLGAEVMLFGTNQPQTFRGYRYLLSHISSTASVSFPAAWQSWRERITFVQSKAPASGSKRLSFRTDVYNLCTEFIYDREQLDADGRVAVGSFNPSPDEGGSGIPHDATYVENHPDYEAFDPSGDETQLDADVYRGPFGAFLGRSKALLGIGDIDKND